MMALTTETGNPTVTTRAISLEDFDRDTLRVVALAYRARRYI